MPIVEAVGWKAEATPTVSLFCDLPVQRSLPHTSWRFHGLHLTPPLHSHPCYLPRSCPTLPTAPHPNLSHTLPGALHRYQNDLTHLATQCYDIPSGLKHTSLICVRMSLCPIFLLELLLYAPCILDIGRCCCLLGATCAESPRTALSMRPSAAATL